MEECGTLSDTPFAIPGDAVGSRVCRAGECTSSDISISLCHQVWRVENNELVPVEKKWLGHFYGGDCYLVLYTYYVGPKVNRIIYIWQVRPPSHCPVGVGQGVPPLGLGGALPLGSSMRLASSQEGEGGCDGC